MHLSILSLFRCGQWLPILCKLHATLQGRDHHDAFWELLVYCGLEQQSGLRVVSGSQEDASEANTCTPSSAFLLPYLCPLLLNQMRLEIVILSSMCCTKYKNKQHTRHEESFLLLSVYNFISLCLCAI